jgi:hypothetical protein
MTDEPCDAYSAAEHDADPAAGCTAEHDATESCKQAAATPSAGNGEPSRPASGIASLASDSFSVLDSLGGVRGIVESVLPELTFLVAYVVSRDLMLTVVVSLVLCAVMLVARLVQRQTVAGVASGTVIVLICLFAAYKSRDARNYYLPACIINAVWAVILGASLAARRPGIGYIVELVASPPTESLSAWYHGWHDDAGLRRAYTKATWLWVLMFVVRDAAQVPLWLSGNVYVLGTVTLVLGVPLFALVCWVSYLVIATPRHEHRLRIRAQAEAEAATAAPKDGDHADGDHATP